MEYLITLACCIIENIVLVKCLDIFLKKNSKSVEFYFIMLSTGINMMSNTYSNPLFLVVPIVIYIIFSCVNYSDRKRNAIVISLIIAFLNILASTIIMLTAEKIFLINIGGIVDGRTLILAIISKYLLYKMCIAFYKAKINKMIPNSNKKSNIVISIILIYLLLVLLFFSFYMEKVVNKEQVLLYIALILCGAISIFSALSKNAKLELHNLKLENENHVRKMSMEFVSQIDSIDKVNEKHIHDFKNHLIVIKLYLLNHEYNVLEAYVNDLLGDSGRKSEFNTENILLNNILALKKEQFDNIDTKFYVDLESNLDFLSAYDLIVIIGNILDNAIEYENTNEGTRVVNLVTKRTSLGIMLEIRNTLSLNDIGKASDLISVKPSKSTEKHGLGIKSIMDVTNELNALCSFKVVNDEFISRVIFKEFSDD